MQMTIHCMTTTGGIHGEGSQREMLHINLGYGLLAIMRSIMLRNLYVFISALFTLDWLIFVCVCVCSVAAITNMATLYVQWLCCFNGTVVYVHLVQHISFCRQSCNNLVYEVIIILLQGEPTPFKPYTNRYHVPYEPSDSTSPFWYSIKRASAYIIVMSSYTAFGKNFTFLLLFLFSL